MRGTGLGGSPTLVFLGERLDAPGGFVGATKLSDQLSARLAEAKKASVTKIGDWKLMEIAHGASKWRHKGDSDSDDRVSTDVVTAPMDAAKNPARTEHYRKALNDIRAKRIRCAKTGEGCDTGGGGIFRAAAKGFETAGKGFQEAGRGAGKAATAAVSPLIEAGDALSAAVSGVPVLGDVTAIVADAYTAPLKFARDVSSGVRLDRAVMAAGKEQIRLARAAAPYAQAVVSFVPGVGSGVSAAIGAGAALAEGRSIDEAVKAAVRDSLPGGPLAAAGFDAAVKVAQGKNVGIAVLESARELIPEGPGRHAFDVGLAIVTGENIQTALARGFAEMGAPQLRELAQDWVRSIAGQPEVVRALGALPKEARDGYAAAMGAIGREGINAKALNILRDRLSGAAREGFDLAVKGRERDLPWLADVGKRPTTRAVPQIRTGPAPKAPPAKTVVPQIQRKGRSPSASRAAEQVMRQRAAKAKAAASPPAAAVPVVARSARPYPPYPRA